MLFYFLEPCVCAGISNKYNDGAECKLYSGYDREWNNGVWCYASTAVCPDAKEHTDESVPGYGPSRSACSSGITFYIYF